MKLQRMKLEHFRQFHGEQEIEFASGKNGRNITVFHGYNGAGKTALLNAFVWCLYGKTTPDMEAPERLLNERALAELDAGQSSSVSVSLRFESHGEDFRINRSQKITRKADGSVVRTDPKLDLWRIDHEGEFHTVGNNRAAKQKRIEQLLPESLYPFFFFNGERVEQLASEDAYDRVESGVKTLLDVAVYERGADHLKRHVSRALADELEKYADTELESALGELKKLREGAEELESDQVRLRENIAALSNQIQDVEKKQASIKELQEKSAERDRLRNRLDELNETINEKRKHLAEQISNNGYLAFSESVLSGTEEPIDAARKRGDIPAKIKPQFVDDLLSKGACICGRGLPEDSSHAAKLRKWKEATGLAELEEKISNVGAMIPSLRQRRQNLYKSFDETQVTLSKAYAERRGVKEDLALIEEELGDPSHGESAAELHSLLEQLRGERESERVNLKVQERKAGDNHDAQKQVKGTIGRLQVQNKKAELVKRRMDCVDRVSDALDRIAQIQKDDVRRSLDEQISEIWSDAAIKNYDATVSEKYKLELTKRVHGQLQPVYGASTGEKQVLALSFVGSIVKQARENMGELDGRSTGGRYPLVMDSPFGSLEDDYRAKVAEWIPSLADQVVVMASKTQWRKEVEDAMVGRIGKEYVLELHTPKEGADRKIEIGGADYSYVVSSNDSIEQTLIKLVQRS